MAAISSKSDEINIIVIAVVGLLIVIILVGVIVVLIISSSSYRRHHPRRPHLRRVHHHPRRPHHRRPRSDPDLTLMFSLIQRPEIIFGVDVGVIFFIRLYYSFYSCRAWRPGRVRPCRAGCPGHVRARGVPNDKGREKRVFL